MDYGKRVGNTRDGRRSEKISRLALSGKFQALFERREVNIPEFPYRGNSVLFLKRWERF